MKNYQKGGLESRYKVVKTNGELIDPKAKYFILRYDKDPHAVEALKTYINSVELENPQLANDLRKELNEIK